MLSITIAVPPIGVLLKRQVKFTFLALGARTAFQRLHCDKVLAECRQLIEASHAGETTLVSECV